MNYEAINPLIIPTIWVMVGVTIVLFITAIVEVKRFDKKITKGSETAFKKEMYYWLDVPYTIFIVLISLFPLMGMLGTACTLLTLDISGATEDLKSNFFQALDTMAMGLISAIFFKFINAFLQPHIEERIAKAKKYLKMMGKVNKREIILDFTSLLDVVMIILFFILFSHLETADAKIALQEEQQTAIEREERADQKLEDANRLFEEAQQKNQQATEKLNEANLAEERQGKNVEGITDFSRNLNIRVKLKMISGSSNWSLLIYKGEQQMDEIPKGSVNSMSQSFLKSLSDMGCTIDDTLLCVCL